MVLCTNRAGLPLFLLIDSPPLFLPLHCRFINPLCDKPTGPSLKSHNPASKSIHQQEHVKVFCTITMVVEVVPIVAIHRPILLCPRPTGQYPKANNIPSNSNRSSKRQSTAHWPFDCTKSTYRPILHLHLISGLTRNVTINSYFIGEWERQSEPLFQKQGVNDPLLYS